MRAANKANACVVAYVAVGSNICPEEHIPAAVDLLRERVEVVSVSRIYRSAALGRPEQADYLNGVVEIRTSLSALELRDEVLRPIEARLKRTRSADTYAARKIDLDLILHGDCVEDAGDLELPDPAIRERPFVAVPLLELAPDLKLPDDGARLSDLSVVQEIADLELDAPLSEVVKGRRKR